MQAKAITAATMAVGDVRKLWPTSLSNQRCRKEINVKSLKVNGVANRKPRARTDRVSPVPGGRHRSENTADGV
jgi:hypothetical protein